MQNSKKILKFDLQSKDLQVKNLLNQEFLNISIKAISSANPNRNKSHFTPDSLRKAVPTCYNKPILAHFMPEQNDFGAHENNGIHYDKENDNFYFDYSKDSEVPIGLIRQNDKVEVIEENGLTWLNVSAALWVQYNYKACKKLLKDRHKKVSVEIEVLKSHYDEKGIEVIEEFKLLAVTILGSNVSEGIPGASLDVVTNDPFKNDLFNKQFARLKFAYEKLDAEQGVVNKNKDSFDSSVQEPDFDDPVENEKKPETTMNQNDNNNFEKGGNSVLSYEQKRALIEEFLNKDKTVGSGPWMWVCDMTESEVVFYDGNKHLKAPYHIESDELENSHAVVDLENAVEVLHTWTDSFSSDSAETKDNMEENKDKNFEETCPDCGKPMSECQCKHTESEEPKDNECNMSKDNECDMSEDVCKECGKSMSECECKHTESEDKDTESEHPEDECKHTESEDKSEECNMSEESDASEDKQDNCDKMSEENQCENMSQETECKDMSDENYENDSNDNNDEHKENHEEHIISPDTYNELFENYTAVKNELEELKNKYSALVQKDLLSYGCETIKNEPDLSENHSKYLIETFTSMCNDSKFDSKDDVDVYLNRSFADLLYAQRKEERKNSDKGENKEFSYDIHKNSKPTEKKTDIDDLKEVNNRLKNL